MVGRLYLPDTNILIQAIAGNDPYKSWLKKVIKQKNLVLSAIVVAEFLSNIKETESIYFKDLLRFFKVLPVDLAVAKQGAEYRRGFIRKTNKVWLSDCLIAATAKVYGATLVTLNKKDYPMRDVKVVSLE